MNNERLENFAVYLDDRIKEQSEMLDDAKKSNDLRTIDHAKGQIYAYFTMRQELYTEFPELKKGR